jgi:hypothetical protein
MNQCYADPERYQKHFNKAGQHMTEGFCARSDTYQLMYFHIPKCVFPPFSASSNLL